MVAGEDIGGFALIERIALAILYDTADIQVRPVNGVQIHIVLAFVGKLIGISKTHIEHLGVLFHKGFHGHAVGNAVQAFGIPETAIRDPCIHILKQAGYIAVRIGGFVGAAGLEAAALIVHGKADALPGGKHHHLALVARILVHHLQYAHVGVGIGIVGVYAGIIGPTTEHFAITGIGEVHGVGHCHLASLEAVTQHIAVGGGITPHEGHQGLTALLRGFFPVLVLQNLGVSDKAGIHGQGVIGPAIKFLPTQTVECYDYQTGIVVPLAA